MNDFPNSNLPPAPGQPIAGEPIAGEAIPGQPIAGQAAATTAPRRGRGVAIAVGIIGAVIISATVSGAAVAAVVSPGGAATYADSVGVEGVTDVSIEMNVGTLSVRFDDVREATLDVTSHGGPSADEWRMSVDEDELRIEQNRSWRGGFPWMQIRSGEVHAEIVLPRALEGRTDGDITLNAGRADVTGDFADLELAVNAGELVYSGSSSELSTELNAGSATVDVHDVNSVDFSINAGRLEADVTGTAPRETSVSVAAGNADVRLPEGTYSVSREDKFGDMTVDVTTSDSSRNELELSVTAGNLTVGYSR